MALPERPADAAITTVKIKIDSLRWMHTSSGVNAISEYLETVEKKGGGYVYKFGKDERPVEAKEITGTTFTPQQSGLTTPRAKQRSPDCRILLPIDSSLFP